MVDYTGRIQLENKRGTIPDNISDVFSILKFNPDSWLDELKHFRSKGRTAIGNITQLKAFCKSIKSQFIVGYALKPTLE